MSFIISNKLIDKSKAIAILTVHKYLMKTMASVEKSIASFTSTHHAERQETQLEKKMQQGYSTLLNMHETVSALSITNMDLIHRFQTRVDGNMEMASVTLAPAVHDSLKQLVEELKGDVADEGRCIVEGCKEMDRRG